MGWNNELGSLNLSLSLVDGYIIKMHENWWLMSQRRVPKRAHSNLYPSSVSYQWSFYPTYRIAQCPTDLVAILLDSIVPTTISFSLNHASWVAADILNTYKTIVAKEPNQFRAECIVTLSLHRNRTGTVSENTRYIFP